MITTFLRSASQSLNFCVVFCCENNNKDVSYMPEIKNDKAINGLKLSYQILFDCLFLCFENFILLHLQDSAKKHIKKKTYDELIWLSRVTKSTPPNRYKIHKWSVTNGSRYRHTTTRWPSTKSCDILSCASAWKTWVQFDPGANRA